MFIPNSYIEKGLICKNKHPELDIYLYNYTNDCQYGKHWDDITLNARGLILDGNGNFIAKGFPKFFNYEELIPQDIQEGDTRKQIWEFITIPNKEFIVQEKMDGSLGIIFWYNDQWNVCTRGSFISDQAVKAKEILRKKYNDGKDLIKEYVYLCEIIYPENKIVLDYGKTEDLFLLSIFNKETNQYMVKELYQLKDISPFPLVKQININSFDGMLKLKEMDIKNQEGFVITYTDGFKMKLKFDKYIEIHRCKFNLTRKRLYRSIKDGIIGDIIAVIPDEAFKEVEEKINIIKSLYTEVENKIYEEYKEFMKNIDENVSQKEFAQLVLSKGNPTFFTIKKEGSIEKVIWSEVYNLLPTNDPEEE